MSNNNIRATGVVLETLPNVTFKVKLDDNDNEVIAHVSGKMRIHRIRVLTGDKVTVEMNNINDKKARIVYRQ